MPMCARILCEETDRTSALRSEFKLGRPTGRERFSMTATLKPCRDRAVAVAAPTSPAPTITQSNSGRTVMLHRRLDLIDGFWRFDAQHIVAGFRH